MSADKNYSGTVVITEGKIAVINIIAPGGNLMEIDQMLALRDMINEHLVNYEKTVKRT